MDKKIVLVTGASSGIGQAAARKLAAERHTVILTGRNTERLRAMEREMAARGQRVVAVSGDLTREEEARRVVTEALKTFGEIHALVHSAGIYRMGALEAMPEETFTGVLNTNVTSLFYLLKELLPHMYSRGGGQVIALSSVYGREGAPLVSAYCASKWGLNGFLEALRLEAGRKGVRVTTIMPGPTLTPAWDSYEGPPLDRESLLTPETVADAVLFALDQPPNTLLESMVITTSRPIFKEEG